jgi:hypothetical protein
MNQTQLITEGWKDFISGLRGGSSEEKMQKAIAASEREVSPESGQVDFTPYQVNIMKNYANAKNFSYDHIVQAVSERLMEGEKIEEVITALEDMIGEREEVEAGIDISSFQLGDYTAAVGVLRKLVNDSCPAPEDEFCLVDNILNKLMKSSSQTSRDKAASIVKTMEKSGLVGEEERTEAGMGRLVDLRKLRKELGGI